MLHQGAVVSYVANVLPSSCMPRLFTARRLLVALSLILLALIAAGYFYLRRPPRDQMERYVPAGTLAYIEVDSLTDVMDGLTGTKAWRELAPALGMSSQLSQVGRVADYVGRLGVGPDEAVLAGRGQFAIALTGLDAETGANDEGAYLHFKPRFAIVIQTHSKPETALHLVRESAGVAARYMYGDSVREEMQDYQGIELRVFQRPGSDRQLIAAASGTLVVVANHESSIKACLDSIAGRAPSLAVDETLKTYRGQVDKDSVVFAFVTALGCEKLAGLGPALFATRFTNDSERIQAVANLFGHLAKQAIHGLLYGAEFSGGGVTDRYLTVLSPGVATEVGEALKPSGQATPALLRLVPNGVEDFTALNIDGIGDLPERTLKRVGPRLDFVAGLALREFVLGVKKQLGLEPNESLGGALGSEMMVVRFNESEPILMLMAVKDKSRVLAPLLRYLKHGGPAVQVIRHRGIEISVSSDSDGRAAAFLGEYLALGTMQQVRKVIDANQDGAGVAQDARVSKAFDGTQAPVISCRPGAEDALEMMLALSELTRATDGSRELLDKSEVKEAGARLPLSVSFTQFREYGVYTESTSAAGNFAFLGSLTPAGEQGGSSRNEDLDFHSPVRINDSRGLLAWHRQFE
ncbi:MAG TPA: hypothetical protein VFV34_17570 [Blastocatellia bacterium]|nr:hypothetical protein [Blastocatellia bacterium]